MSEPVNFQGCNVNAASPKGLEEMVGTLPCFMNGHVVVSAWRPDPEEMAEIIRTGLVFVSVMSGSHIFATYVGAETDCKAVASDTGKVW